MKFRGSLLRHCANPPERDRKGCIGGHNPKVVENKGPDPKSETQKTNHKPTKNPSYTHKYPDLTQEVYLATAATANRSSPAIIAPG